MRRTVWKYAVEVDDDEHTIGMPAGSRIVHVDSADARVVVFWAEVEPKSPPVARTFRVFGTGHPIPEGEGWGHVGTAPSEYALVWHLYERAERSET